MFKSIKDAKQYFYNLHDVECNQKYNKTLPYSFHLEMVEKQAMKFQHLIHTKDPYNSATWVAIYGHDSIEDARLTYNDIKTMYGELAAEVIYLCTENKGRTRADRKDDSWYKELATNDMAVFVKLCDIIANVKFSLLTNSSMYEKYRSEYNLKVREHLYCLQYKQMFTYLDKLFEL